MILAVPMKQLYLLCHYFHAFVGALWWNTWSIVV